MQTITKVALPAWYNRRYSIEYLAWRRKLDTGQEIRETVEAIAQELQVTTRTIYNWIKQQQDSEVAEISEAAREVCANYFGVPPSQILSENCEQLGI